MAYSPVASVIFSVRNADKTTDGEIGRFPVTVGQTASVIKAAAQCDNAFSRGIQKGLEILGNDKIAQKLGKVAQFASDNVNPLICVSSGIKVAKVKKEDRKKKFITELGCLLGMFAGEGWMKKNLDKILANLSVDKKWIPFIKGVVFVTGSISCSLIGEKGGKILADNWDKPLQKSQINKEHIEIKA